MAKKSLARAHIALDFPGKRSFAVGVDGPLLGRHPVGRSFAEGARLLKAEHPDKAKLIDAYGSHMTPR